MSTAHRLAARLASAVFAVWLMVAVAPAAAERPLLRHKDQVVLEASPQKAWDAIKRFDSIHAWHPAVESTELLLGMNGKPLAVREFQLKGGGYVISELLAYDEGRKWYRYRIIKTSIPLRGYVAEIQVKPAPGGGSVVLWSTQFQRPDENAQPDQDDRATEALVQGVVKAGLANLAAVTGR